MFELKKVNLKVEDEKDIEVMSSLLQEGLISLSSITFDKNAKTLRCLINRFCWEHAATKLDMNCKNSYSEDHCSKDTPPNDNHPKDTYYRVHTALNLTEVKALHTKGFHQASKQRIYNILALKYLNATQTLHILCSDHCDIAIKIPADKVKMHDIDTPWPTPHKPKHIDVA